MKAPPSDTYSCEVRFSVVLYGGVSLAVYINGVANQLLKLVASTEKDDQKPDSDLLKVYRDVAHEITRNMFHVDNTVPENRINRRVRFVVDVISGTSAGGINGIFLAKALARKQNMDGLKSLWIKEGDITKLINDPLAISDGDIAFPETVPHPSYKKMVPPQEINSLLSSDRMYRKLCEALYAMEQTNTDREEIDRDMIHLYITATNFYGRKFPIRLTDMFVQEKRYKHVFHLSNRASEPRSDSNLRSCSLKPPVVNHTNHFSPKYIPFLAFAARCTSAFPFAFEPIRLDDIDNVFCDTSDFSDLFLVDSSDNCSNRQEVERDYFVDGGYLDNKPFSYVIDTVSRLNSSVPVIRKLLYIEPSPEDLERDVPFSGTSQPAKPNPIKNLMAAVTAMPRYETIMEDIERIQNHNQLVSKVARDIANIEYDQLHHNHSRLGLDTTTIPESRKRWQHRGHSEMMDIKGEGYATYRRIDLSSCNDYLAAVAGKAFGFCDQSAFIELLQLGITQWRDHYYGEEESDDRRTYSDFLFNYNLPYHLRHEAYVQRTIDAFFLNNASSNGLITNHSVQTVLKRINKWRHHRIADGAHAPTELTENDIHASISAIQSSLLAIKRELFDAYIPVREWNRDLHSAVELHNNPLLVSNNIVDIIVKIKQQISATLTHTGINQLLTALKMFYATPTDSPLDNRFKGLFDSFNHIIETYLDSFKTMVSPQLRSASETAAALFTGRTFKDLDPQAGVAEMVVAAIADCFLNFSRRDMVLLPIIYGTDVGEGTMIDVHRISPRDATSLVDETTCKISKLYGTSLGNFGAFFSEAWRKSDLLWGELDGAECIINALIPDHEKARVFVSRAHKAILSDTLRDKTPEQQQELLCRLILNSEENDGCLEGFITRLHDMGLHCQTDTLQTMYATLGNNELIFNEKYIFSILKRTCNVVLSMTKTKKGFSGKGIDYLLAVSRTLFGFLSTSIEMVIKPLFAFGMEMIAEIAVIILYCFFSVDVGISVVLLLPLVVTLCIGHLPKFLQSEPSRKTNPIRLILPFLPIPLAIPLVFVIQTLPINIAGFSDFAISACKVCVIIIGLLGEMALIIQLWIKPALIGWLKHNLLYHKPVTQS